jgi:hypothetical protein
VHSHITSSDIQFGLAVGFAKRLNACAMCGVSFSLCPSIASPHCFDQFKTMPLLHPVKLRPTLVTVRMRSHLLLSWTPFLARGAVDWTCFVSSVIGVYIVSTRYPDIHTFFWFLVLFGPHRLPRHSGNYVL